MTALKPGKSEQTAERIAITGLGVLCALGDTVELVFSRMLEGQSGIGPVTRFSTDALQCSIAGEVSFGAASDSEDLCAQYAIAAARQALASSGLSITPWLNESNETASGDYSLQANRFGLALGTCNGGILSLEKQWTISQLDESRTAKYPFYQQGDDTAIALGLQGPVVTINTACAASGNAIGYACDMLRWGYADAMLAGGSDPLSHSVYAGFNVLRALNPQPSSPFGSQFGLNLGEGAAFVVLEPLNKAILRGAKIYGEICGYGLSNDAYHETAPHPEGLGVRKAVEMALKQAGVPHQKIEYINTHGTGTLANDQAEIAGLRSVFGSGMSVPLSSSKAYFGHNLGAAASVELVTSLYAIDQGFVPATLHFDDFRAGCEGIELIAGEMKSGRPAYMLSNNSAFGGHNVSIVVRTGPEVCGTLEDATLPASSCHSNRPIPRVAIVGLGAVGGWGICTGGILQALDGLNEQGLSSPFSLKEFDKDRYERRMNRLCQFSIGSALAACQDAGWKEEEFPLGNMGYIYGTSRGSTSSISKFLGSVFEKGPELASSIYFPHTVINSISGKTAEKLGLQGFSSSLSTGGNEGLAAALYGAGMIRSGVHPFCLIGAGDEHSELSDQIDAAKQLDESRYSKAEGSVCLVLADMDEARLRGMTCYAELRGFGTAFGSMLPDRLEQSPFASAVLASLAQAELPASEIDLVLLNSVGRPDELELELMCIRRLFGKDGPPVVCLNENGGYGESVSSLLHLGAAAEIVSVSAADNKWTRWPEFAGRALTNIVTVSSSVNGNNMAAIVSRAANEPA
ncbi:beta-ketoacyl-[acyl-carrier-protein] synthase family protein [Paenibacillus eucommiae]|uniref:3-oxoacyl-[acyl-carrier-protein] synthase II n=1 Tax=Paenibacillus eucommiae TaxID=1355755 RepID=A0ABS4IQY6_9BACL|nr:beta-ketoacyl-[acyl-carrier-protein] synthase family protein [Paenibacillus eucommiae]MBP1989985.1 3-oxoacyl-[acyl-carrier-protein] synthase II [Paenibacillus eucommiae]